MLTAGASAPGSRHPHRRDGSERFAFADLLRSMDRRRMGAAGGFGVCSYAHACPGPPLHGDAGRLPRAAVNVQGSAGAPSQRQPQSRRPPPVLQSAQAIHSRELPVALHVRGAAEGAVPWRCVSAMHRTRHLRTPTRPELHQHDARDTVPIAVHHGTPPAAEPALEALDKENWARREADEKLKLRLDREIPFLIEHRQLLRAPLQEWSVREPATNRVAHRSAWRLREQGRGSRPPVRRPEKSGGDRGRYGAAPAIAPSVGRRARITRRLRSRQTWRSRRLRRRAADR